MASSSSTPPFLAVVWESRATNDNALKMDEIKSLVNDPSKK